MTQRLFFWALISALAGFLFGFDTVVISGAETTIQSLWQLSDLKHGLLMSMALWGTVVGSLIGYWPTDRYGRKRTLVAIGSLYVVSAIWSGLAQTPTGFMIARFIGGLGVGISTVAAPLYISEISPPAYRGRLAGMFQFNIVFGILIAFMSNSLLAGLGEHAWRWMLGVEAIPALIYTLLCFTLPESPRWLVGQDRINEARDVIRKILVGSGEAQVESLLAAIVASREQAAMGSVDWSSRLRKPMMLAFLIAFFNQMSGINAVLYFAPRIFQLTGLDQQASLLQSVGIGVTNLIFTFVGLYLIDRLGRRTLLVIGSFGYIASLALVSWAFFAYASPFNVAVKAIAIETLIKDDAWQSADGSLTAEATDAIDQYEAAIKEFGGQGESLSLDPASPPEQVLSRIAAAKTNAAQTSRLGGLTVLVCIFAFIAAHAVGQGAVIWVFIAEIFPNAYRAAGQSLGSFTHWIFAALLTLFFPKLVTSLAPGMVFAGFCGMMVLQLVWIKLMVPETKGVPLEEIEAQLGVS